MKYRVLYQGRNGDVELHRDGCNDIKRTKKSRGDSADRSFEATDLDAAIKNVIDDLNDSFGWSEDSGEPAPWDSGSIIVSPCTRHT